MKKKLTALLLSLAMCASFLCVPAMAADTPTVSGTYASGVVTVTGSGFVPTLKYSMIAVKDSGNNLVAIGGATADASGNISASITTGAIANVTGHTVTVYNDNGGEIAATGDLTLPVATHTATVTVNKDGAVWSAGAPTITLQKDSETAQANGSSLADGTYKILANTVDTGKTIIVNGEAATATLDYYTVSFAVTQTGASGSTIAATYDDAAINTDDVVLGGKALVITVTGAGAQTYTYTWTGDGTSGETTAVLTINALAGKVNASCAVKGLNKAATPSAAFEASTMTLSDVTAAMKYSVDGGTTWVAVTGTTADLSGKTVTAANGIQVKDMGDGTTTGESDVQTITLTQAAKPTGVSKTDETAASANNGTLVGVTALMEYRVATSAAWTPGAGTTITGLAPSTYQVRVKGAGTVLASESLELTIAAYSAPVTTYTITASAGTGGSISPSGSVQVQRGTNQTFSISASSGYSISTVTVDGVSQGAISTYTFTNVTAPHTIAATFSYNGGGGGGGGGGDSGSGNGGGSTTTPGTGDTITVTTETKATLSGDTATATVTKADLDSTISKAVKDAAKVDGVANVQVKVEASAAATQVKAELPAASLKTMADSKTETILTVTTPLGTIAFDSSALSAIAGVSASGTVTVAVAQVDNATLSATQQTAVGGSVVIDLSVSVGDTAVSSFKGGTATVSVPYTLPVGQKSEGVVVYFMDDDGIFSPVEGGYSGGTVTFETGHFSKYVIAYDETKAWDNPFSDVSDSDWYYEAVRFASMNGLFNGTTEYTFSPNATMTRSMLVTVLHRQAGEPAATGGATFADVPAGQWYTEAVAWAAGANVVTGTGAGFEPNGNVTREQLATVLYRYAGSPAASGSLSGFADSASVSAWATDAMSWAVGEGIMTGKSGSTLDPAGNATRAEVATMLMRFVENAG